MSEVPKEAQFCSAITTGNATAAKALLYEINLFDQSSFSVSPAIFCLWAARQTDLSYIIEKLEYYFPHHSSFTGIVEKTNIEETLRTVLNEVNAYTLCRSLFENILSVTSLDLRCNNESDCSNNSEREFIHACCLASLEYILDQSNSHIDTNIRNSANKLYEYLKPRDMDMYQTNNPMPHCIQNLVDVLKDKHNTHQVEKSSLCNIPTYLPSQAKRDPRDAKLGKLTKQITKSIEKSIIELVEGKDYEENGLTGVRAH